MASWGGKLKYDRESNTWEQDKSGTLWGDSRGRDNNSGNRHESNSGRDDNRERNRPDPTSSDRKGKGCCPVM